MPEVRGHARGRKIGAPIYFDPDQVDAVNEWRGEMSFSEAVRTLFEWGLEAEKE